MKYFYLFIAAMSIGVSASAQSKLTFSSRQLLGDWRAQELSLSSRGNEVKPRLNTREGAELIPSTVSALVTLTDENGADALREAGFDVETVIGRVAVVSLPLDRADRLAELPEVVQISMGQQYEPMLNRARTASQVASVQAGTDLPQAFDGTGVVCGLMDTGLDPNHVNFREGTTGSGDNRVKVVWKIQGTSAAVSEYSTPAKIASFTTDDSEETHGTHVLGIMGGSYNGTGVYGTVSTSGNAMQGKSKIPYYGVARNADLAVACGSLYDACIIKAAQRVVNYAESVGKPAVLNLSLGSNTGPHDGTSEVCQVLSTLGQKALICVSAGNEGEDPISIRHTFTATSPEVKTMIDKGSAGGWSYLADAWSDDSRLFNVAFVIVNKTTGEITYRYNLNRNLGGGYYNIGSSQYAGYSDINETPAEFSAAFSGYVMMTTNLNTANNRYNMTIRFNVTPTSASGGNLVPGLIFSGSTGQSVSLFCNSHIGFTSNSLAGWTSGTSANSANDMACGDNVLAIGSYTSRNSYPSYAGAFQYIGNKTYADTYYQVGKVSPFSSYGQQINGKSIPTFCAPGATLVSSISTYYFNAEGLINASVVGVAPSTVNSTSRQNYWDAMMGTSMASPYAAGVCALLLQADPTLTYAKALEALTSTAVRDADVTSASNQVQWGAGKLDALAAIKHVLGGASIGTVMADDDMKIIVTPTPGGYEVFAPGTDTGLTVTLFDIQGRPVLTARSSESTATLNTAALSKGIYVLTATAPGLSRSQKVTVR